jgi:protein-S-isoprenylcysteine O-methyltransferase Ste14
MPPVPPKTPEKTRDPRPQKARSSDLSALTRYGWIAGLAGTAAVLAMGYQAQRRDALAKGWGLGAADAPVDPNLSMAFVLVVVAAVMFVIELAVRLRVERGRVISIAPDLRAGRYGELIIECVLVYLVELGILQLAFAFYRSANVYAFGHGDYYKPWFAVMTWVWQLYLWGGLPYVLLTRALQHDPVADRKQAAFVVMKAARRLLASFTDGRVAAPARFDRHDRSSMLGLVVKLFFVPLMTVFFADQFGHLVKNYAFILGPHNAINLRDVHNLSYTVVFSVDVGLAWCGYVLSSRWIKNTLWSVEPTAGGWIVALMSYPPFNGILGNYYSPAGENAFFSITSPRAVMILAVCSILSFSVYTTATAMFGLRFSNLTHRGIVTTGPYAIVRHPAYAAKNFSWWCVMFPVALYQAGVQESAAPLVQVLGLVALSGVYYLRAITEERHLRKDAEYRAYARKVRYRFIPGIL